MVRKRISAELKQKIIDEATVIYGINDMAVNSFNHVMYLLEDGRFLGAKDTMRGHKQVVESETLRNHMRLYGVDLNDADDEFQRLCNARMTFVVADELYVKVEKPFEERQVKALFNLAKSHELNIRLLCDVRNEKDSVIPSGDLTLDRLSNDIKELVTIIEREKKDISLT
ncbi:MAG: hypothetical protein U1E36_02895 [Rickettsiales bacterium]